VTTKLPPHLTSFAEAVRLATEAFEKKVKEDHENLIKAGYRLVETYQDERVYAAPTAYTVKKGKLMNTGHFEVKIPYPHTVTLDHLRSALKERVGKIFPDARVSVSGDLKQKAEVEIEGDFVFKFTDMPLLAEALGTEKLSFRQTAAEEGYRYSSWTYDSGTSQKLFIDAVYLEE
jgi:hypothetical protein